MTSSSPSPSPFNAIFTVPNPSSSPPSTSLIQLPPTTFTSLSNSSPSSSSLLPYGLPRYTPSQLAEISSTRQVISDRLAERIAVTSTIHSAVHGINVKSTPSIVSYTPPPLIFSNQNKYPHGPSSSSSSLPTAPSLTNRIVKITELPIDPLHPSRHKIRQLKVPRHAMPKEEIPILSEPIRPLSAAESREWIVPPVVSQYKTPKGFTIPIDKRLSANANHLTIISPNDKHSQLANSLFTAEDSLLESKKSENQKVKSELIEEKKHIENLLLQEAMEIAMGEGREKEGGNTKQKDRDIVQSAAIRNSSSASRSSTSSLPNDSSHSLDSLFDSRLFSRASSSPSSTTDSFYDGPLFAPRTSHPLDSTHTKTNKNYSIEREKLGLDSQNENNKRSKINEDGQYSSKSKGIQFEKDNSINNNDTTTNNNNNVGDDGDDPYGIDSIVGEKN